jgi:acylphosphatase
MRRRAYAKMTAVRLPDFDAAMMNNTVEPPIEAIHAEVRGRVQGVGFRYTTERTARQLGLAGWVRNLPDGSVEVWAQGTPNAVQRLRVFLAHGPRAAVVESVSVEHVGPDPTLMTFGVTF